MRVRRAYRQLKYFHPDPATNDFSETKPRFRLNFPSDKVVLLLHGFSSSSNEFDLLIRKFERTGINYYAPQLTGFGLSDLDLLCRIKYNDWIRDAENAYKLLSSLFKEVVVAGHSAGGALALWLAEKYNLSDIYLTAPYALIKKNHRIFHLMTKSPVLFDLFKLFHPVVNKSRTSNSKATRRFVYDTVPLSAVKAVWDLTTSFNFSSLKGTRIWLYVGKRDNTVNETELLKLLDQHKINYILRSFMNSGHNVFEDNQKEEVAIQLLDDIQQKLNLNRE